MEDPAPKTAGQSGCNDRERLAKEHVQAKPASILACKMRRVPRAAWWLKLIAGLRGLRKWKSASDQKIPGIGEAEIAGDCAEIGSPLILVFVDGLEYHCSPRKVNVDEGRLPLLRSDLNSLKLQCAAVNSTQQTKTKGHLIYKLTRDSCQARLLRVNQNGSGQAMDYPSFVSWRTVIEIGAKLDAEKIPVHSIIVENKSLRHQAQEFLELELIFVLRLF